MTNVIPDGVEKPSAPETLAIAIKDFQKLGPVTPNEIAALFEDNVINIVNAANWLDTVAKGIREIRETELKQALAIKLEQLVVKIKELASRGVADYRTLMEKLNQSIRSGVMSTDLTNEINIALEKRAIFNFDNTESPTTNLPANFTPICVVPFLRHDASEHTLPAAAFFLDDKGKLSITRIPADAIKIETMLRNAPTNPEGNNKPDDLKQHLETCGTPRNFNLFVKGLKKYTESAGANLGIFINCACSRAISYTKHPSYRGNGELPDILEYNLRMVFDISKITPVKVVEFSDTDQAPAAFFINEDGNVEVTRLPDIVYKIQEMLNKSPKPS